MTREDIFSYTAAHPFTRSPPGFSLISPPLDRPMPHPNTIRRLTLHCAISSTLIFSGILFAQAPETASGEIDWYVPGEPPTEPVSIDSTTIPGAPPEELFEQTPRADAPSAPLRMGDSRGIVFGGGEERYEMLSGGEFGMDTLEGSFTLEFAELDQFSISPQAGVMFLDGPTRTDLPARLYSGLVEFRWFDRIGEPLFYELAFIPGIFTDGEATGGDALRLQARAVGYLAFSEQMQIALGATYLDRQDVSVLPIVGLIHSPREDVRLEIMFPRPRLLKRIATDNAGETWVFLAGELGGGAWAIERVGGGEDIANYRDYRLVAGLERKSADGGSSMLEAGYVFGRELTYDSGIGDFDPEGTLMVRCGWSR